MIRRHARPVAAGALAAVAAGTALALLLTGATARTVAAVGAGAGLLAAIGLGLLAGELRPPEPATEERHTGGPGGTDRRRVLRAGVGAVAVSSVAVAIPAARRVDRAVEALRATDWARGLRVVDADGRLVVLPEVAFGELLTVFPEGHVGSIDSQAVLIREPPGRFVSNGQDRDLVVEGAVIYSKLCTHMACPLGLYQQTAGTLLCPCHQAAFDVLAGGEVVSGPARRPLPQLPFEIDEDGHLVALGGFTGVVGTGFWWRP